MSTPPFAGLDFNGGNVYHPSLTKKYALLEVLAEPGGVRVPLLDCLMEHGGVVYECRWYVTAQSDDRRDFPPDKFGRQVRETRETTPERLEFLSLSSGRDVMIAGHITCPHCSYLSLRRPDGFHCTNCGAVTTPEVRPGPPPDA